MTGGTVGTGAPLQFTIADLERACAAIGSEPMAEYMRSQGCDPSDGWELIIPVTMWAPFDIPSYVRRSIMIKEPVLVNPRAAGLTT